MKWMIGILLVFIFSCSNETKVELAGGEDFPNTIEALKKDLFEGLSQNAESVIPEEGNPFVEDDELLGQGRRLSATNFTPGTSIDFADTAKGFVLVVENSLSAEGRKVDSIWIRWNEKVLDEIKDNEDVLKLSSVSTSVLGKISFSSVERVDSNEVIAKSLPYMSLKMITGSENGLLRKESHLILNTGADGILEGEGEADNQFMALQQLRFLNGKLIELTDFSDADGDSLIRSGQDSSLVLIQKQRNLTEGLQSSQGYRKMERTRLWVYANDSTKIRLNSYYKEEQKGEFWKLSAINNGDPFDLLKADTLWLTEEVFSDKVEGTLYSRANFKTLIDPYSYTKNQILSFSWEKFSLEKVKEFVISVEPKEPLGEGVDFENGALSWRVLFDNGEEYLLEGQVENKRIQGVLRHAEDEWEVDWEMD